MTQIWDCGIKDYLSSKWSLQEYIKVHTPLMLMQYPSSESGKPLYEVKFNKYNYTGIYFDSADLSKIKDVDPDSPAFKAGAMDSMINHYTANKRLRSNDAYTPDGRADMRPDMPSVVYTNILKKLYPDVPVILGGIEASLRRVTHYDYWEDSLRLWMI